MHKLMLKFFGFLKSLAQFLKIVSIFCILCLILYWIKDLTNLNWAWLGFISPLLDSFLAIGNYICDKSISFAGVIIEYKYCIAAILFLALYYVAQIMEFSFKASEELYNDGRRLVKKIQENAYNKNLEEKNTLEQTQIKKYQIYVAAYKKKRPSHLEKNLDPEEDIRNMNKFLIEKTGVNPVKYGEGFLYSFGDFSHIDDILPYFFKLIQSDAPLNYIICVQILPKVIKDEFEKMKKLIDLSIHNQITTLADTAWRYKFNETHKYNITQLGVYQKDNDTFEVHEFTEM